MRVIVTAGGTGGHIYPALAIIEKIKELDKNTEVLYIGTSNRMEKDIVPNYGIKFIGLEMYGFNRRKLFSNFKTIKCLFKSIKESKKIIRDFKPDIIIGAGGYITVPVLYAGSKLGVKTVIHEQNAVPGLSNKYLSKKVDKIFVSYLESINYFDKEKVVYTGNPTGDMALRAPVISKGELNLHDKKKLIVSVMGSLGASNYNNYLFNNIDSFSSDNYELLIITGKKDYDFYKDKRLPKNIKVLPYVDNLAGILKRTDLLISRAGASTIAEIIALRLPSILIPSPYVPNNHQYKNAKVLVLKKEAMLLEEKDLSLLSKAVNEVINDDELLKLIKSNLNKNKIINSTDIIYKEIKELANGIN